MRPELSRRQRVESLHKLLGTVAGARSESLAREDDPLRKKSGLLALILNDRPEKFLKLRNDELVEPVIEYHALR